MQSNVVSLPWGAENPNRGLSHHDLALAFVAAYPVGEHLSQDAFGQWLESHNQLSMVERFSVGWKGYIEKRLRWRTRINRAAEHSRMAADLGYTFTISFVAANTLKVIDCLDALASIDHIRPVTLHAAARRQQMNNWARGIPWEQHPPHAKHQAELLFKFQATLHRHAEITRTDYDAALREFIGYLDQLRARALPPRSQPAA